MFTYLRNQNSALRDSLMTIAYFEKLLDEGALGRYDPEMRVALNNKIKNKEKLLQRLVKNLTIACPELYCDNSM